LAITVPAHATIGPFHFQSNDFKIDSKQSSEVVMPQFSINPGSSNEWHVHPGPGFIVVTSGTLTLYQETADGGCTRSTYGANQGFVEAPGRVHVARNEGGTVLTGFRP
jgi:quercetin dioxygenase-like cupin family protein